MLNTDRRIQVFHGRSFHVLPEWRERLAEIGIAEGTDWPRLAVGRLVSRSPSTRCFEIPLEAGGKVFFKRYVYPPRKWLEFWLRPSKAAVEAFGYARLRQLGVPTLETLALGEVRSFGMLKGTFLVTRGVPNTTDMEAFARDFWRPMEARARRRVYEEISTKLLQQVRRAHGADFFHHDLKWRNILIRQDTDSYTPLWIDCPRARYQHLRRRRGVMVDLSGLARLALSYCSLYDRYRFLRRYLGPDADRRETKRLFRRIQAHLARRPPKRERIDSDR